MRRPPRTAYLFRSGLSLCKRSRDPPGHTDGLSPRDSPTGLVLPPTRGTWRSPGANARRRCSCQLPILLRTPELAPNASGHRYYPGDLTHLCRWSWSEPQLTVQCTHAPSGHHRQARVGSETGSFIGIRPGLEPQNADTLRDRFAGHSQCLCRRAEDVDHVYRQINVAQRPVGPRTEDLATSRVHRDDLVPLRLQITRDHVRRLGAVGGGSNHCDRLGPLVDPNKFLVGKMSHAVHRLASFDVEHYGKNVSGADVLPCGSRVRNRIGYRRRSSTRMVAPKAFSASSKNAKWWAHQSSEPPCIITVSTAARAEQRSHRSAAVRDRVGFLSSEAFISATPPRPSGDFFDISAVW